MGVSMEFVSGILQIIGSLGLFLFGMKLMSDGLQNSAGERMQKLLNYMTRNRFTAFLTGLGVTSVIQSSSATTVFVVSFVSAGLLTLTQAIGVIMGANIGTTVTAWIVSIFGFKFDIIKLAIPAIAIGFPFTFMKAESKRYFGETMIGFGLLFIGLMYLKDSVPDIKSHPEVLQFLTGFTGMGFLSNVIFVAIGTILTVIIQSSSAAMAITLTMTYAGWIDFQTACALCLGENIGTTITAQLAAFGQSVHARRAAMAHTMFNVIGVIWMLIVFRYFTSMVDFIVPGEVNSPTDVPNHLSMFHTMFNVINSAIFIWFVPLYAKFIEKMLPAKAIVDEKIYRLKYISSAIQDTPEINIFTVKSEIIKMTEKVCAMYDDIRGYFISKEEITPENAEKMREVENYTDQMQEEISRFIADCMQENPSEKSSTKLNHMLKIVDELESIADCCNNLTDILERKAKKKIDFPKDNNKEIAPFFDEVHLFLDFIKAHMHKPIPPEEYSVALGMEKTINSFRNSLKKNARKRIQGGSNVKMEILYIDILQQLEHIGDYALNIVQEQKEMPAKGE